MAEQASRRLATPSTFKLLVEAAEASGILVDRDARSLRVSAGRRVVTLAWPPGPAVPKSSIPGMLASRTALRSVPAVQFARQKTCPYLPGIAKPDLGSRGEGQIVIRSSQGWNRALARLSSRYIVQPLLEGAEYRVTVCRSRAFAAARLVARRGLCAMWEDASLQVAVEWLRDLHRLVMRLGLPGAGFDILVPADGKALLLDVNPDPALSIHLVTGSPRDLAPAFIADWARLVAGRRRLVRAQR